MMAYNRETTNYSNLPFKRHTNRNKAISLYPKVDFLYDPNARNEVYNIVDQDFKKECACNANFQRMASDPSMRKNLRNTEKIAYYWLIWRHNCQAEGPTTIKQLLETDEVQNDLTLLFNICLLRSECGDKYRNIKEYDSFERILLGQPKASQEPPAAIEQEGSEVSQQGNELDELRRQCLEVQSSLLHAHSFVSPSGSPMDCASAYHELISTVTQLRQEIADLQKEHKNELKDMQKEQNELTRTMEAVSTCTASDSTPAPSQASVQASVSTSTSTTVITPAYSASAQNDNISSSSDPTPNDTTQAVRPRLHDVELTPGAMFLRDLFREIASLNTGTNSGRESINATPVLQINERSRQSSYELQKGHYAAEYVPSTVPSTASSTASSTIPSTAGGASHAQLKPRRDNLRTIDLNRGPDGQRTNVHAEVVSDQNRRERVTQRVASRKRFMTASWNPSTIQRSNVNDTDQHYYRMTNDENAH